MLWPLHDALQMCKGLVSDSKPDTLLPPQCVCIWLPWESPDDRSQVSPPAAALLPSKPPTLPSTLHIAATLQSILESTLPSIPHCCCIAIQSHAHNINLVSNLLLIRPTTALSSLNKTENLPKDAQAAQSDILR